MLDHLVYAAPDLAGAVADFAERTGVAPVPGGSHAGLGTANFLVGLGGDAYLEIIGPDDAQPAPDAPRPFGIDDLAAARIVTWAIHPPDLDALVTTAREGGYDPGDPHPMSRLTPAGDLLQWRLTPPDSAYGAGLVPFLIDWGSTPHPTSRALPQCPLLNLRATHPDPASVRPALAALGVDLAIDIAEDIALIAVLAVANGPITV